jgi:hypothetical protein
MEGYEKALMEFSGTTGVRSSPVTSGLFTIGSSPPLKPTALARFHTTVAKLLYLSHRVRPDTGVAVAYLTTRVTCANLDDVDKLDRVLMYINGSVGTVLTLSCPDDLQVNTWIDAAFASHDDGKSQSGEVRMLGHATVYARSQKQKIVSKDSTEAELVALTDMVDGSLKLEEFMIEQGHVMQMTTIRQDNTSTITIATTDGGKYRTKHMRVRKYKIKEYCDQKMIEIVYCPTGNMVADVMTKPLQGTPLRSNKKFTNSLDAKKNGSGGAVIFLRDFRGSKKFHIWA